MGVPVNPRPGVFVTLHEPELVVPAEPTEECQYFLSNLDQNVAVLIKTVYQFGGNGKKRGDDPAQVLKESLAKVLVHYPPVAGRMGISPEMKLNIHCNAAGVVFVEARADLALEELGDISTPNESLSQLVYSVPGSTSILDSPPATVQVTKFNCGGWVLGLALNHALFDGIGANEFVNAWASIARGQSISVLPFLDRSILKARDPLQINFPHDEFAEIEDLSNNKEEFSAVAERLVYKSIFFSPDDLDALKKAVLGEGNLKTVTTFEVLSALTWRARVHALELNPSQITRLYFAVDGRKRCNPPIPEGYMGNGIVLSYSMTTAEDLIQKPLSHAVKLVQDAVRLIDDNYIKSAVDYFEKTRARPALANSMLITTWSRLPFHTTDFGWGEPIQQGPVTLPDPFMVLFLSHGAERKSINMLLGLPPKAMVRFEEKVSFFRDKQALVPHCH